MRTMCRTRRRRTRPPRTLSPRTREPPWTGRRPPRGRGETMLSRIADAMFWIGRYVERADQTTRILDVKLQSITEDRSEEHTSELQSRGHLVCSLLLETKK